MKNGQTLNKNKASLFYNRELQNKKIQKREQKTIDRPSSKDTEAPFW